MGGGQAGHRDARARAGHIAQANGMAETDRVGMSAVFATDTHFHVRTCLAAPVDSQLHQLAHTLDIQHFERIVLQYSEFVIHRQELVLGILAREREGRLGQVIGAEREELGFFGQAAGAHA